MMPNHAVMVHAELGSPPCETVSTTGVCCCGLTAFKYGYLSVLSGASKNAIITASELVSVMLLSTNFESRYEPASDDQAVERLTANPAVAFEAEFLRWMLSDGAAAVLITDEPRGESVSLRVDWVEIISMAHVAQPCMYLGAEKLEDGTLLGWRQVGNLREALERGHFQLRQDVRQLASLVAPLYGETLDILRKRRGVAAEDYDWFLPHYSSQYFREPTVETMNERGFEIPTEKWFTNLTYKGNTGAASVFIMLEELLNGGHLRRGQKLLCLVPESSRFTYGYLQLTVV
jgi:3-oxoacyl-[acyl-carrier-protein] synthase-3